MIAGYEAINFYPLLSNPYKGAYALLPRTKHTHTQKKGL